MQLSTLSFTGQTRGQILLLAPSGFRGTQNVITKQKHWTGLNSFRILKLKSAKIHFNIIISPHAAPPPRSLVPSGLSTKILREFLTSPIHSTCPAHLGLPRRDAGSPSVCQTPASLGNNPYVPPPGTTWRQSVSF